jgi:hypothetical protein
LRRALAALAVSAAALAPGGTAGAQGVTNLTYREIKLGVLAHDVHFLGGKESGADINPELIFASPVSDEWAATVPAALRWLVQPRPTIGGTINTAGDTDQAYIGGTWTWQFARDLFRPGDGLSAGIFFGPGFNDGKTVSHSSDRKSLGSHVLFREAADIGYRIDAVYTVSLYIDHISNAGFDRYNQSINDVGLRFGFRF